MTLALTRTQFYALIVLAFLTVVALTILALYTVGHIDVWHLVSGTLIKPDMYYPH